MPHTATFLLAASQTSSNHELIPVWPGVCAEMPDDLLKLLLKQQEQHSAGAHSQEDDGNHTDGEGLTEGEASSDRATPLAVGEEASLSSMPDTHPGALMAEAQQLVTHLSGLLRLMKPCLTLLCWHEEH